jgi:hypothetical protein
MLVAERQEKNRQALEERHNVPLLRALEKEWDEFTTNIPLLPELRSTDGLN